jgi:hypothetical protein
MSEDLQKLSVFEIRVVTDWRQEQLRCGVYLLSKAPRYLCTVGRGPITNLPRFPLWLISLIITHPRPQNGMQSPGDNEYRFYVIRVPLSLVVDLVLQ